MSPVFEPSPEFGTLFPHAVLNIHLGLLITAEGQVEPGQESLPMEGLQLIGVEEIGGTALIAEEEPVAPCRGDSPSLLQEGPEWSNPGARSHHDHRTGRIGGRTEMTTDLNEDWNRGFAGNYTVGQPA